MVFTMKSSFFSILQTPTKTVQNQFHHNSNDQKQKKVFLQSFEFYQLEREVLKELDTLSKKHSVQFFPSQHSSKTKLKSANNQKIQFPIKNNNLTLSSRETNQNQEGEQKSCTLNKSDVFQINFKRQDDLLEEKGNQNKELSENIQKKRIVLQKKNWVSPIVQKQNQLKRQQDLILQRQRESISNHRLQENSFQVEASSSSIYSLTDKKKQIEEIKKQSHSFYGDEKVKQNKSIKNKSQLIPVSNLCQLPNFNSSFRIQKINRNSCSSSNKNADKQRSLSNTSYSLLDPWVKQEFFKTITESKSKSNNSFDFYFYDDSIATNLKTDVSFYKKSIDSKK